MPTFRAERGPDLSQPEASRSLISLALLLEQA